MTYVFVNSQEKLVNFRNMICKLCFREKLWNLSLEIIALGNHGLASLKY